MLALTLIFVVSGAAGLIYESIWSRYLGLFVGHSAYAQVIVLVIFLGGMSLGAFAAGEFSHRVKRPLRWYAYVELAAGIIGLAFHFAYVNVTAAAYDYLFPALAAGGGVGAAKWTIAGLLILPQSILLGTTFPLMSAAAIRLFPRRPGRDLALLYFANSLGAAAGVLVAGFILLRIGGLPGTLLTAAGLNVLVFVAAIIAESRLVPEIIAEEPLLGQSEVTEAEPVVPQQPKRKPRKSRVPRAVAPSPRAVPLAAALPTPELLGRLAPALLAVSFGTAVASFIYEIAWIRMLSLVLGSATHAFELMLSAFILGLALGAYAIRAYVDRFTRPVFVLGVVQWFMGLLALATLPLYVASFHWAAAFQAFFERLPYGYEGYVVARYGLCLLIMLPATFCAGMTLPLITRTLLVAGTGERAIGRVYAINTAGSIVGVLLAAIVLMPLLGLRLLLATGALADMAIGAALLWPVLRRRFLSRPRLVYASAAASVAFVTATLAFVRLDRTLLTGGVFRYGTIATRPTSDVLFYRDGRTATVSVRRHKTSRRLTLATNGKPDASLEPSWVNPPAGQKIPLARDNATQILLPIITLAHRSDARMAAVIGQGSGMSSHFLLGSPHLEMLATIEIEPEMIAGSRLFLPANSRVFEDPRSVFVVDDAKSFFAARQQRYDLILSEPSNPWVSGVSGLFTVEFYRRVRRHLTDGGVLGQWLHLYEMTDDMVLSVLRSLDAVFEDYQIFMAGAGDIVIIASKGGRLSEPDWDVVRFPAIAADFAHALTPTPAVFERLRVAGRLVVHPMLADVRINSDFFPVLDLSAERARYTRARAHGFTGLTERWFDLAGVLEGRRLHFTDDTLSVTPGIARVDGAAFGARLRHARAGGIEMVDPSFARQRPFTAALNRLAALETLAGSGAAPSDWRAWLGAVMTTERELHFGTSGVSDDRFYNRMIEYARAHSAPGELISAMEYLRGMRAWDFTVVLERSAELEATHRAGTPWLSPDALREGTVVALLVRGDTARAHERLNALTPLGNTSEPGYQFRTRLLRAAIGGSSGPVRTASTP